MTPATLRQPGRHQVPAAVPAERPRPDVAISDAQAEDAMRRLARDGVVSGESGAAGAGGLLALCAGDAEGPRARLRLTPDSTVLVISTEGATDPEAYDRIVQAGADDA